MLRSTQSATSRREFLVRSAATAAGTFLSIGLPALGSRTAMAQAMSSFTPSIWFTLTPDGKVTMHIVKAEMGQHVGTGLAQIIAEELEVKWDDVRLDSPLESVENFAIYGLAYTVNSGSITTEFDRLSRAGAAGRMALIEAGAKVLGTNETDCTASNSRVTDRVSGRSVSYGEIIQKVKIDRKFAYPEDFKAIKLKVPGTYNIIGKSIPALDIPSKTNGQAKYGIDVFLPNMVYGALVIPRTRYGSKVKSIDDSEARKIPGFVKAVKVDDSMGKCTGWVVALAEKFPAAIRAAQALKVDVDPGPYGGLNTADLFAEYAQTTKNAAAGANWVLEGDVDKALAEAEKVLEMEYTTDMVCHATMEPLNATVHFVDGAWHVYSGTQSTSFARMTLTAYLSKVLGQKPEDIKIYVHESILGGGFGGKQDYDEILAAAYCAKEAGRPVKLIQTRESTFATSFARTPTYHKLKAGLKNGQLVAMDHNICCGWMGPRFSVGKKYGTDWLQLDSWDAKKEDIDQWSIGGSDHWYDVENHRVRAFDSDRTTWAVQASALRTVSNSYNMFVVESFMDEVTHALNRDPLEFRLALLNGKGSVRGIPNAGYPPGTSSDYYMDRLWISLPWPNDNSWPNYESTTVGGALRLANCLRVAAGRAGWGAKKLPPNTGMGIAVSSAEERQSPTWVAGIAEVTVDPKNGQYKINRLTIAMDPGTVINPLNAKAQIQGAALWGTSQVMGERLTLKHGALEQSNFHDYTPIRLADVPPIDVELIDSGHHPSGVGEPASTVVAPAVANAIYNAVGVRVRHMPITAEAVLAGLKKKA
ncbi:MAG TPA: molybdopterin cofactor-binding domain-containing protein [Steroidobacteraceae bacterium]|jgi:isoquinoline 1-oxidoreductase|nr:molybdopterin cofactor-binding domain-containing protein [Steroidobacteraceae bacterium]